MSCPFTAAKQPTIDMPTDFAYQACRTLSDLTFVCRQTFARVFDTDGYAAHLVVKKAAPAAPPPAGSQTSLSDYEASPLFRLLYEGCNRCCAIWQLKSSSCIRSQSNG